MNNNLKTNKMENIHVISTDKPSRIYLIKSNNKLGITSNNPEFTENFGSGTQNQNIYITNNEEIKEGDWRLDVRNNNIYKSNKVDSESYDNSFRKKIILTTDQDLIKDGVQAINDEFLEWFVKNPNCEWVKLVNYNPFSDNRFSIIIPKEEPKQETLEDVVVKRINDNVLLELHHSTFHSFAEIGAKWQQEQETLEEYIKNYNKLPNGVFKTYVGGYIDGAKGQQERSYSEEEVELIANKMVNWAIDNIGNTNPESGKKFDEVISKFKKK